MKNFGTFIKFFDFISNEVRLTIYERQTRLKTVFGGIIGMIAMGVMFSFGLFFFIKLLQKENIYVTSSMEYTNDSNLVDSNNFPFLIRLTDKQNKPFSSPETIYSISLKYWYNDNQNQQLTEQKTKDVTIEPCDINKHFGHYKDLFENQTDISTFYCIESRPENMSIYGKYGDVYPFGYYHFYITMCQGKDYCLDKDQLMTITENVYMDFRTVDFSMDSLAKKAKKDSIHSDRHMLSSTVYKRIWFYLSGVKYITDDGLFFASESTELFSRYDSMRYDIDLRDINTGTIPGTFATMTILNTGTVYIYNRKYLKIQEYLASVGGIITFVNIVASLLNYIFSLNSYYLNFLNQMQVIMKIGGNDEIVNKNTIKPMKIIVGSLNDSRKELQVGKSKNNTIAPNQVRTTRKLLVKVNKWYHRLLPFQLYKKEEAIFLGKCVDQISSLLNINTILLKIEESSFAIKEYCLEKKTNQPDPQMTFNCLPNKKNRGLTDSKRSKVLFVNKEQENKQDN